MHGNALRWLIPLALLGLLVALLARDLSLPERAMQEKVEEVRTLEGVSMRRSDAAGEWTIKSSVVKEENDFYVAEPLEVLLEADDQAWQVFARLGRIAKDKMAESSMYEASGDIEFPSSKVHWVAPVAHWNPESSFWHFPDGIAAETGEFYVKAPRGRVATSGQMWLEGGVYAEWLRP
ncbi:MAG TPA: hypothetical protein PK013_04820 [Thermosynergistes sp.]|nr:hypothetical protein [Thermosynergistes sp.]